jgi:hypothetical protein
MVMLLSPWPEIQKAMDSIFGLSMAFLLFYRGLSPPERWADRCAEIIIAKPEANHTGDLLLSTHEEYPIYKQHLSHINTGPFVCQGEICCLSFSSFIVALPLKTVYVLTNPQFGMQGRSKWKNSR